MEQLVCLKCSIASEFYKSRIFNFRIIDTDCSDTVFNHQIPSIEFGFNPDR